MENTNQRQVEEKGMGKVSYVIEILAELHARDDHGGAVHFSQHDKETLLEDVIGNWRRSLMQSLLGTKERLK